jgi:hypothetical protein
MSRTFDGKCVTTMVRIKPMRAASRVANRAEIPAKTFAQKKIAPSAAPWRCELCKPYFPSNFEQICKRVELSRESGALRSSASLSELLNK